MRKLLLIIAVGLQIVAGSEAVAEQLIASVVPLHKFTGDNALVLEHLSIKQNFSISFWAKSPEQNPEWAAILDYRHNSTKSFAFHQKSNEQNHFSFGAHSKAGVHGVYANLKPGVWYHMVLVKAPGRMAIYQDGKKVDETDFDKNFSIDYVGDEILTIGGWGYGGRRWLGSISCLYIYDYPIGENEISALAKHVECINKQ